jgi:hypothetical protein
MRAVDTARERLEAAIWQAGGREVRPPEVEAILTVADKYAQAYAAEFASAMLDGAIRDQRTAERRQVLADALRGRT